MERTDPRKSPHALLAFGRRVSAGDAFEELVAHRGWKLEPWQPTFVERGDLERPGPGLEQLAGPRPACDWDEKQILRRPPVEVCADGTEPRLMVASASELPSLYFVEWHYIDFVLSCLGNVSEAARVLGIRRSTLQRKRKKRPPSR